MKVCPFCGKEFKNYKSYATHKYRFHRGKHVDEVPDDRYPMW